MRVVLFLVSALFMTQYCTAGPPDSLLTHIRPFLTPVLAPVRTPTPEPTGLADASKQDKVIQFTKKLYRDLGGHFANLTSVADKYQGEFDQLDQHTGGKLAETLSTLSELRLLDLQTSIRHARRMHKLVDEITGKSVPVSSI